MPRRGNVPKREVLPDPLYNSVLVTKLTNSIMLDGKKGVAQKVVYGAFDIIKEKTGKEPMEVYTQALENIMNAGYEVEFALLKEEAIGNWKKFRGQFGFN